MNETEESTNPPGLPTPFGPRVLVSDLPATQDGPAIWLPPSMMGKGLERGMVMAVPDGIDGLTAELGLGVLQRGDVVWYDPEAAQTMERKEHGRTETLYLVDMRGVFAYER